MAALLARKAWSAGQRVLIVEREAANREAISRQLWSASPEEFAANGEAGENGEERQPILLSQRCDAANGARIAIIADGEWREELGAMERVLLLFDEAQTPAARALWRSFDGKEDVTREIFKRDSEGRWRAGG